MLRYWNYPSYGFTRYLVPMQFRIGFFFRVFASTVPLLECENSSKFQHRLAPVLICNDTTYTSICPHTTIFVYSTMEVDEHMPLDRPNTLWNTFTGHYLQCCIAFKKTFPGSEYFIYVWQLPHYLLDPPPLPNCRAIEIFIISKFVRWSELIWKLIKVSSSIESIHVLW